MSRTIVFPDGTRVTGGALARPAAERPDFGLYAYGHPRRRATFAGRLVNAVARRPLHGGAWVPAWPVEWLYWPDFGVPPDREAAAAGIVAAWERARSGERVEVRCFGGKGRTGTMLACMAVLAGIREHEAIDWVRREYSPHAVERDVQREWVAWFARAGRHLVTTDGPADAPRSTGSASPGAPTRSRPGR